MANPFTVQPLGGFQGVQNITQGMQSIARRSEMNDQEEQAQRQAEQKSALNTEAQRLLSSGNTQEIAAFSIANPDYGKAIREQIKFASDETDANMMSGMQQIIAGADPEQVLNDRATFVESQGGDATQTRQEIQRFREDPEGYVKQMGGLYAFMDPEGSEAFGKATAGPGGPQFGNVQPGDFTPPSLQKYSQTGDYRDLERYESAKSVNIGGVPHVFDPAFGGYRPASVSSGGAPVYATAQSVGASEGEIAASVKAAEQSIDQSQKMFERLGKVTTAENNLNEAIRLVDDGAATGPVISMLPSVTQASVELDNVQAQMGLDVIGSTTFGALSKDELLFALNTALPNKLQGPALKDWLVRKRDAQKKLKLYIEEAAIFLGKPGNTIPKFLEMKKGGGAEGAADRDAADAFIKSALGN
jgi:hypothetical protein